ncbi:ImmA/IrrE family metallo-endopeptidase [Pseudomonas sp. SDO5561_S422]
MPVRTAQAVLDQYWDRQLPVDPYRIARAAGASVEPDYGMSAHDLSGCFDVVNNIPVIRFNPDDANVRQRFTIAHELGHMFLKHGHSFRDNAKNYSSGTHLYRERDANSFAAELLMPKEVVEWLVFKEKKYDVEEMAGILNVSGAAMHYRLMNLGLIRY